MADDKKHITYLTTNELNGQLSGDKFLRVHKSFIINQDKIKAVAGNNIFMIEVSILSFGKTYRDGFYENINSTVIKTNRNYG